MSEFTQYLQEVFAPFGPISTRRMFGGYGIYHQGLMFALVVDDTLYLKTDAENVAHFQAQGLGPFAYPRQGKLVKLSYYLAPEEMLEDPEQALLWGQRAWAAAQRRRTANAGKKARR